MFEKMSCLKEKIIKLGKMIMIMLKTKLFYTLINNKNVGKILGKFWEKLLNISSCFKKMLSAVSIGHACRWV